MRWCEVELGNYINTLKGFAFKSEWFGKIGVPVVKVKDFTQDSISSENVEYLSLEKEKEFAKYKLQENDVIIQTVGSWASNPNSVVGKVVKVPSGLEGALLNQNAVKIFCDERIDNGFLFYLLKNDSFKAYIIGTAQGAANQASITLDSIKKYTFRLPPIYAQRKIASILSAYDDLIENNAKRIKLLEEVAQNIYKEWFVHFRFPGYEKAKFENGLPKGWRIEVMDNIASISGGGTPSTQEPAYWDNGDILWFSPTDLSKNSSLVLLDSEKKITLEGLRNSSAKILPPRTILMSSRATIGLFGLISKECSTNQGFINIVPNDEIMRYYLLYNLKNRKQEIINKASGTTFKEISKKTFKEFEVVIPVVNVLEKFMLTVNDVIDGIENLEKQNQQLKEARDILLPRLMNGEIEVDATIHELEEA